MSKISVDLWYNESTDKQLGINMGKKNKYDFLQEIKGLGSVKRQPFNKLKQAKSSERLLPDYGHHCVENPIDHLFLGFEHTFVQWNDREGYIGFNTEDGYAGTVIVSVEEAKMVKARGGSFYAEVKPSQKEKFITPNGAEWVIPFRVVK